MKNNLLLISILFIYISTASSQSAIDEEQVLTKLSNDWMTATMNRDGSVLDKIVAPEFTLGGTDFENPSIPRMLWMKNTMENLKIDSVKYIQMKANVIEDIAIVQSIFYWSVAFMGGPATADTVNLVDTWMKREQGWQVVSRLVVDK